MAQASDFNPYYAPPGSSEPPGYNPAWPVDPYSVRAGEAPSTNAWQTNQMVQDRAAAARQQQSTPPTAAAPAMQTSDSILTDPTDVLARYGAAATGERMVVNPNPGQQPISGKSGVYSGPQTAIVSSKVPTAGGGIVTQVPGLLGGQAQPGSQWEAAGPSVAWSPSTYGANPTPQATAANYQPGRAWAAPPPAPTATPVLSTAPAPYTGTVHDDPAMSHAVSSLLGMSSNPWHPNVPPTGGSKANIALGTQHMARGGTVRQQQLPSPYAQPNLGAIPPPNPMGGNFQPGAPGMLPPGGPQMPGMLPGGGIPPPNPMGGPAGWGAPPPGMMPGGMPGMLPGDIPPPPGMKMPGMLPGGGIPPPNPMGGNAAGIGGMPGMSGMGNLPPPPTGGPQMPKGAIPANMLPGAGAMPPMLPPGMMPPGMPPGGMMPPGMQGPVAGPIGQPLGMLPTRRMAVGGQVAGQGSTDTVPAMLTPGEFVVNRNAVQNIGVGNLERINAQHFQTGGEVPPEDPKATLTTGGTSSGGGTTFAQRNADAIITNLANLAGPGAHPMLSGLAEMARARQQWQTAQAQGGPGLGAAAQQAWRAGINPNSGLPIGASGYVDEQGNQIAPTPGTAGYHPYNPTVIGAYAAGNIASGLANAVSSYMSAMSGPRWQMQRSAIPSPDSFSRQQPPVNFQQQQLT